MLTINRVEDSTGARYVVGLDSKQLLPFLQTLAPKLETKTKDARYIFNDERKEACATRWSGSDRRARVGFSGNH